MNTDHVDRAMKPPANPELPASTSPSGDWLETVRRHVASLRYGVVQVTVHAGKVVQVERTERFRFESPSHPSSSDAP